MTKRDFVAIAAVIKRERDLAILHAEHQSRIAVSATAMGLAHVFAEANPRFERDVFLKACGM